VHAVREHHEGRGELLPARRTIDRHPHELALIADRDRGASRANRSGRQRLQPLPQQGVRALLREHAHAAVVGEGQGGEHPAAAEHVAAGERQGLGPRHRAHPGAVEHVQAGRMDADRSAAGIIAVAALADHDADAILGEQTGQQQSDRSRSDDHDVVVEQGGALEELFRIGHRPALCAVPGGRAARVAQSSQRARPPRARRRCRTGGCWSARRRG